MSVEPSLRDTSTTAAASCQRSCDELAPPAAYSPDAWKAWRSGAASASGVARLLETAFGNYACSKPRSMDTRKYRLQSPAPRTSRMLRTGAALFPAGLRVDAACAKSGYRATAARYAPRSGSSSTIPDRCRRSTGMSTRSGGRSAPPGRCWRGLASGAGAGGLRCEWLSATACRLRVHGGMRRPAAGCACVPGG